MPTSSIRIDFLSGTIAAHGRSVALTRRQTDLLSALALHRRRLMRSDEIVETVWPEKEPYRGSMIVKVLVHRLRRLAGDYGLIDSTVAGYALGAAVSTDLDELDSLAARLRGSIAITSDQAAGLRAAFARLTAAGLRLDRLPRPLEQRVRALAAIVGERLGAYALRAGDHAEALALTDQLLSIDACDESAWEIAIRTHLAMDDRAAAIRAYRRYTSALESELGIAPSAHVLAILSDGHARTASIA
jgi:DNA-binding SARP family transcriptional activator